MALNSSRAVGYKVLAADWNDAMDATNRAAPGLEVTISSLDGNGSIALPTGEETDVNLDAGGSPINVNGCSVPDRSPWPLYLVSVGAGAVTLKHESGSEPTPAKRFRCPGNTDLVLTQGEGCTFRYKNTAAGARWVAVVAA